MLNASHRSLRGASVRTPHASQRCSQVCSAGRRTPARIAVVRCKASSASAQIFKAGACLQRGTRRAVWSRKTTVRAVAMVNVDFANPSLVLGVSLIGCSVGLLQLRNMESKMSRDPDIVVAAMISIVGGALIFQGWRLDPLLLLCQALTSSVAFYYAIDVLRMRSKGLDAPALLPPPSSTSVSDLQNEDLQYMQQGSPQQQQQQQQQYGQINYNQAGRPGPYLQPPTQAGGYPWANQQQQEQQQQQDSTNRNNNSSSIYLPSANSNGFRPNEDYSRRGSASPAGLYDESVRYDNNGNMQQDRSEPPPVVSQAQYNELYNQNYPQQGQQQGYDRPLNGNEQYGSSSGYYPDSNATGSSGGSSGVNYSLGQGGSEQQTGATRFGQNGSPAYSDNPSQQSYPDQTQGESGQRNWQQQRQQQQQWQPSGNDSSSSGLNSPSERSSGPAAFPQRMISPASDTLSRGAQRQGGVSERVEDWE